MMRGINHKNTKAFLALVSAGLWEKDVLLLPYHDIKWKEIYRLATEQSVLGLVLAGLEHSEVKPPQNVLLQWIGEVQMIEQRNKEMNTYIAELIENLRKSDVYAILVKGQGVALCYEKPLWRSSGDIDLLLSNDNYNKAKSTLIPIASEVANENTTTKHQALIINGFDVELHGKMPFSLSMRVEEGIDEVLNDLFCRGNVKSWDCNGTQVFLPAPDNDVILVFTHFLHHFFIEGVGLRQICDWCRLMWTYKDSLNRGLLESRIRKMGLMSEWKAFYNLASRYLGMPDYDLGLTGIESATSRHCSNKFCSEHDSIADFMVCDSRFDKKADRIMKLVLESGNFGHNKDLSYRVKYKGFTYKLVSLWRRLCDFWRFATIFPLDAPQFFVTYVTGKVK